MGGQELTWYINRGKIVIVDILPCLNTLLKTVKDVTMSVGMVLKAASFWYFYYNSGIFCPMHTETNYMQFKISHIHLYRF